jgi:predicted ATPase
MQTFDEARCTVEAIAAAYTDCCYDLVALSELAV